MTRIKTILLAVILSSCAGQTGTITATQPAASTPAQNQNGFAVLELFTSEGCSSCPQAEALLPRLKDKYDGRLYVLSFHVDYWNRRGWIDKFSDTIYSQRQEAYANFFNKNSTTVYTPQAIINGKIGINGSNRTRIEELVNVELAQAAVKPIKLAVTKNQNDKLTVSYSTQLAPKEVLHISLVLLDAATEVQAGGNAGKKLKQMYIVRSFKTFKKGEGTIQFALPPGATAADYNIISFTQSSSSYKITGAAEIPATVTKMSDISRN